jgi:hypothetical protein
MWSEKRVLTIADTLLVQQLIKLTI